MRKLVIVQPYVPKYRVEFFNRLFSTLTDFGIRGIVAAANPEGKQALRGDTASADWLVEVPNRQMRVGKHSLSLGGSKAIWADADAVIVGHLGSSLDTYRAIIASKSGKSRVGVWGHIKPYVNEGHPLDLALEKWQLRNADHVFAYTSGGSAYAIEAGVAPERITTVMNSVDTEEISRAIDGTGEDVLDAFLLEHSLTPPKTLSFIGGLDDSKRIDFLVSALDEIWIADPTIRVLVAGRGAQEYLLDPASERGQVIRLGFAGPQLKALMGRASRAILMPGRIGLVAIESLMLQLPIITTDWPYHSAEAEYLREGSTRITSANTPHDYAASILSFLRTTDKVNPDSNWSYPTLDDMVTNFAEGVKTMMAN